MPIDDQKILERLSALTVSTWNYKSQSDSTRHIGPMAQDFYEVFGVGEDDRHINTVDADGVSLAAIKGLYQIVQEQEKRLEACDLEIKGLEKRLERMERRMMVNGSAQ